MKILIIRNYPNYMNVKNATYNIQELGLAAALVRKGHICDIVFWTDREEEVVVCDVPDSKGKIHIFYKKAITLLKNTIYKIDDLIAEYDIIQPCEYNQIQAYIYARRYPDKVIIYHGQYWGKENKRYNQWCKFFDLWGIPTYIRNHTLFITKSDLAKQYLVDKGLSSDSIYALGVGINKNALYLGDKEKIPDECLKIDTFKEEIKLLYVGEFMPRRHIKFIGKIVKELNQRGIQSKLIIVGKNSTKYGKECKDYFDREQITQYIYHIEKVEQKYLSEIYKRCTAFIFPSTYEIFGMVLLESMYFGLPVFCALNGGSSMIVKNNENGFILDELKVEAWVEKLTEVHNNKILARNIGESAHNSVVSEYTWDALADKFISIYKKRLEV